MDQEHKQCKKHYTKVKKLVKQLDAAQDFKNNKQYQECVDKSKQILVTEPAVEQYLLKAHLFLCHCNHKVSFIDTNMSTISNHGTNSTNMSV